MQVNRRKFLQVSGLALLAVAAKPAFDLFTRPTEALASTSGEPAAAKRLAMAIDLRKCTAANGCTDCISACHVAHNVPNIGSRKEEIKWIWEANYEQAFAEKENKFVREAMRERNVLMLCNHCDSPPCVRVCPTQATYRRSDGIVMMDYHRCIGCRYCMAACPFGARSFNFRDPRPHIKQVNNDYPTRVRGVVEKCNFCEERVGSKQPACVEACKYGALIFGELKPGSDVYKAVSTNFTVRRKVELGSEPQVYYIP